MLLHLSFSLSYINSAELPEYVGIFIHRTTFVVGYLNIASKTNDAIPYMQLLKPNKYMQPLQPPTFQYHAAGPSSSPNIHLSSSRLRTVLCNFCVNNCCKAALQSAAFSQSSFVSWDAHPHEGQISSCAGVCTWRLSSSERVRCLLWLKGEGLT